jgi:hypothetical protein
MSGVQFARVEGYAITPRKTSKRSSADDILAEAMREEGHCNHVEQPLEPTFVFGDASTVETVRAELDSIALFGKTEIALAAKKGGGTGIRKLGCDAPVLTAAVFSYPGRTAALNAEWKLYAKARKEAKADGKPLPNPPASWRAFKKWQDDVLGFAKEQYDGQLRFAVAHFDEEHPHLHVYAVAKKRPDDVVELLGLHPGRDAKEAVRAAGKEKGETEKEFAARQMKAYKSAMQAWQDAYHDKVGKHHGQARLGPKRRRMSRGEWKADQKRNRELASALNAANGMEAERKAIQAEREAIRLEREAVQAERDAAVEAAQLARDTARAAKMTIDKLLDDPAAYATAYESRKAKKVKTGSGMKPSGPSLH